MPAVICLPKVYGLPVPTLGVTLAKYPEARLGTIYVWATDSRILLCGINTYGRRGTDDGRSITLFGAKKS
jgi:hypothetical protein